MEALSLYHPIIKGHNRQPFHFESREEFPIHLVSNSAMCGDKFCFYIRMSGDILSEMYFKGNGCAVSKASGSILVESLEGKSVGEARELVHTFLAVLRGMTDSTDVEKFQAFAAVIQFPERYDCAALHWHEMEKFLERFSS